MDWSVEHSLEVSMNHAMRSGTPINNDVSYATPRNDPLPKLLPWEILGCDEITLWRNFPEDRARKSVISSVIL